MTTSPTSPTWVPRTYRYATDQPRAHTSVAQVMAEFAGIDLSRFKDPDGTLTTFQANLARYRIPEVSALLVSEMRTPYDWCLMRYFVDGPGVPQITLPVRNIAYVLVCFIRVLPSLPWYRFLRFRNVDGSEFDRAGYSEPIPTTPFTPNYNLGQPVVDPPVYTGIEDADLLVDTRARTLVIPPRALISPAGLPLSNFNFVAGQRNIEVHFLFGYPPNSYVSGLPIQYDDTTNAAIDPNPHQPVTGPDPIDWSSGMPIGLTQAVARFTANLLLRQQWKGLSMGLSSISVDGASESYGQPYGGLLDAEDTAALSGIVAQYGIRQL